MTVKSRNPLARMFSHDIAVDLGTANTLVAVDKHGIVINEPSVVATNRRNKKVVAVGEDAKKMIGRTPRSIIAARPLVDGVVSDFEITEYMLKNFVHRLHNQHKVLIQRPRMIVGLPSGVTEVEKRAVEEAARSAGARRIFLIEEPIAAAIGAGVSLMDEKGSMIVDIGGGTTEIALISSGGVVLTRSLRIAGDEITETMIRFMRNEFNLLIGERTAEDIKTTIGIVGPSTKNKRMKVRGRNILTGLPQEITLRSDSIKKSLSNQLRPIIDAIKTILEEAPPELLSDVMEKGIVVAGGGGLITGIDKLIEQETRVHARVPKNALTAVVEGALIALSDIKKYEGVVLVSE